MGLSQQLADFAGNVANAPDGPKKAALLARVHEVTMALREYQAELIVQGSSPVSVTTPLSGQRGAETGGQVDTFGPHWS